MPNTQCPGLEPLLAAWPHVAAEDRAGLAVRRPLLRVLDGEPPPAPLELERLLAVERLIWQRLNEKRYARFARAWKDFFRRWQRDDDWQWPVSEPFWLQHRRLLDAVRRHGLPEDPLADSRPEELLNAALQEVTTLARATETEHAQVLPPLNELLP